jgi:hypothetical protein
MAWTSVTFSYGSVLTSTKMTQVQDNFTAVAQGLSGAPSILTAAIGTAAVTGAKLATTLTGGTTAMTAGASYTLTSGFYNTASAQGLVQIYVSGSWRGVSGQNICGGLISDGTNVRVYANATETLYTQVLT